MKETSRLYHQPLPFCVDSLVYEWHVVAAFPFEELIISWNAARPLAGKFLISVSIKIHTWTEWLPYAAWGHQLQHGGAIQTAHVQISQDICELLNGKQGTEFRVRIEAVDGAQLTEFYVLYVCASLHAHALKCSKKKHTFIDLKVPLLSQMVLAHPRCSSMCSPTSTSAVINFLLKSKRSDPLTFAFKVRDERFDILGNWVLNVAEAFNLLGRDWRCWVERLTSFDALYESLVQRCPVVVSVKQPLAGSALPYETGHLMVVKGYDPEKHVVLCMDPAFPEDTFTAVSYELEEFLGAWGRRGYVAYIFRKKEKRARKDTKALRKGQEEVMDFPKI